MHELRQENAELRQQLQTAQEQLRATALSELDEAIRMIELLEEENLHLRGEMKRLRKQLEERTRVVVHVPATRAQTSRLTLVGQENGSRMAEDEEETGGKANLFSE